MNRFESLELRAQRAQLAKDMAALLDSKGNFLKPEYQTQYETMDAEQRSLAERIARIENVTQLNTEMSATGRPPAGQPGGSDDPSVAEQRAKAHRKAFGTYLRYGDGPRSPLTVEERALLQNRVLNSAEEKELRALGVGEATGGQTFVPTGFANDLEQAMAYYGPMLAGGPRYPRVLRTTTGAPLPYPTSNDTSNTGEQIDENPVSDTNTADPTMGSVILNAFMFSSKYVLVPLQLLQDSAFDIEAYLRNALAERLGRILNTKFTTGAGSTTPMGIVPAATLGATAAGSFSNDGAGGANSIGSDDLIDLEHSVDIAYRRQPMYMGHDATIAHLKKLKDKQGRAIWVPGVSVGAPDTINGHPYAVNNDMDQLQTEATSPVVTRKTLLFGDMTKYLARIASEMLIFRDESTFIRKAQVAFVAFMRADGNLIDAGTHPVKYLRNMY